jgi:hypothetical protein
MSQLTLTSDPLGSATTGTLEFENPAFYMTGATAQRGAVLVDQYILQQATYTLANNTSAQKLFGATTNGQITLVAGTYEFDCQFLLSSMSGSSSTFAFALAGGATFNQYWTSVAVKAAAGASVNAQITHHTGASGVFPTNIATASTATAGAARISGITVITVGGTLIPQIQQVTASTAAVVGVGSYFKIRALGGAAAASSGNWS